MDPREFEIEDEVSIEKYEVEFLKELIAILSDPKKLNDAVINRTSIAIGGPGSKKLSFTDYLNNPSNATVDHSRVLTTTTFGLGIPNVMDRPLNERIVLDAAIWEAQSKVFMKRLEDEKDLDKKSQLIPVVPPRVKEAGENTLKHLHDFKLNISNTNMANADKSTIDELTKIKRMKEVNNTINFINNTVKSLAESKNTGGFSLGRLTLSRASGEFIKLHMAVKNICDQNIEPEEKLKQLRVLFEKEYTKNYDSSKQTPQDMVDNLNKNQNKDHPQRVSGLLLRECTQLSRDPLDKTIYCLPQLRAPQHEYYKNFQAKDQEVIQERKMRMDTGKR